MIRILLYVAALVCLFGGAIMYGGNAIGAWDPLPPAPTPPPAVEVDRHTKGTKTKKHEAALVSAPKRTAAQRSWVRQADALCRKSRVDVQRLLDDAYGTSTPAGVVALFARARALNATTNQRFLALGAPAGYTKAMQEVRALFAKEERLFDSMYEALKRNDTDTYYALSDRVSDVALDETAILADDLGAVDCDVDLLAAFG
jgi:hypothetical protein